MKYRLLLIPLLSFVIGCAQSVPIRPLPEGTGRLHLAGGAIILPNGPDISDAGAIPIISAGYHYGFADGWTIGGEIYPLFLLSGLVSGSVGVITRLNEERGTLPQFTASGHTYFFNYEDELEVVPTLRLNASWSNRHRTLFFVGMENTFLIDASAVLFSPFVGIGLIRETGRGVQLELKLTGVADPDDDVSFEDALRFSQIGIFVGVFL